MPAKRCTSNTGFHILKVYKHLKRLKTHFRCNHPECSHTILRDLAVGRKAECPFCGNTYILTYKILNLAFPHCDQCTVSRANGNQKLNTPQSVLDMLRDM